MLTSIKGFGPQTTYKLMAEMYDLANYESASAAAADAGLNPSHHESGTSVQRQTKAIKDRKSSSTNSTVFASSNSNEMESFDTSFCETP